MNLIQDLIEYICNICEQVKEAEAQATKFRSEAAHLQPICYEFVESFTQHIAVLEEVVTYLKNYAIGETPSVNIDRALAEAESHLQSIRSIDSNARKTNAIRELEYDVNLFKTYSFHFVIFCLPILKTESEITQQYKESFRRKW